MIEKVWLDFEYLQISLSNIPNQCITETNSIKDYIQILQAFLTPVIAIIAAGIAWQQYQTNQSSFRNQVYERRLKVFNLFMSYLTDIIREGKTSYERVSQFYAEAIEAEFLFNDDVTDKLEELRKKGFELIDLQEQLYPSDGSNGLPVGEGRSTVAKERGDLFKWFTEQIKETKDLFKQEMKLHSNPSLPFYQRK